MLLVPAIAAFPELFPLPRVGMSHARWLGLFQKWVAAAAVPTTGWVGALRCAALPPTPLPTLADRVVLPVMDCSPVVSWQCTACLLFVNVWGFVSSVALLLWSNARMQDRPMHSTNSNLFDNRLSHEAAASLPVGVSLVDAAQHV